MARRRLPGLDPIGRQLRVGPAGPYTVVGVVGDVRQESLALGETDAVYMASSQWKFEDNPMSLVVHARSDAATLTSAVRAAVWAVDKDQPIVRVATMDALLTASAASRRFALRLFEAFGLAALVLAAAGLYGVLAGSVVERWREIGVRSALGASRSDIVGLVLRQGLRLTTIGVVVGIGAALLATRLLATLLFGVSHVDPAHVRGRGRAAHADIRRGVRAARLACVTRRPGDGAAVRSRRLFNRRDHRGQRTTKATPLNREGRRGRRGAHRTCGHSATSATSAVHSFSL